MKKTLIAAACVVLAAGIVAYFVMRDRDERQIRNNLGLLAETVSKRGGEVSDVPLMGRTRTMQSLFTDGCTISVGPPVPDIQGIQELTTVYFQGMRIVGAIEVSFHDVSVAIGEDRATATSIMTAKATRSDARDGGVEAREIQMKWRNIDGRWRIDQAEAIRVLH